MSIPKIIHYCWFGRGEIPERDKRCIESWKKYCPDYEIIQWNEDNYDISQNPYTQEAYNAKRWGFVPDYIRMDLLYRFGGIYMDTDVELLRGLNELLDYSGFMGLEAGTNTLALGLGFGAEKGSPLLKELCDLYRTRHFTDADGNPDLTPSPIIVTNYLNSKGYTFPTGEISHIDMFTVFPEEYFCPQNYLTGKIKITENTFSIHHYHASWQTNSEKEALKIYLYCTKLFGKRFGELVYQTCKTLKEKGFLATAKKIIGHLRKSR